MPSTGPPSTAVTVKDALNDVHNNNNDDKDTVVGGVEKEMKGVEGKKEEDWKKSLYPDSDQLMAIVRQSSNEPVVLRQNSVCFF